MIENLRIIARHFPDFEVHIALGEGVPEAYRHEIATFPNTTIKEYSSARGELRLERFVAADTPGIDACFIRDADSRINRRDRWCIRAFLASPRRFHIIRDHYWHKTRIPGGLWGIKRGLLQITIRELLEEFSAGQDVSGYGADQGFLEQRLYPLVAHDLLLHTNINRFADEQASPIESATDDIGFCGNVVDYEDGKEIPAFSYWDFNLGRHLAWLREQRAWDIMVRIEREADLSEIDPVEISGILDDFYLAYYYLGQYEDCQRIYRRFEYTHINEHILANSNFLFPRLGKRIIGSTDPERHPGPDEVVVVYGNYPWTWQCLPHGNKVYRHARYWDAIAHDAFEFEPAWEPIGTIYVLNLEDRLDRYLEITCELSRARAPLDRIVHYRGHRDDITGNRAQDAQIGAVQNHLYAVRHFLDSGAAHCLILEDDFTFTSSIKTHLADLETFFRRDYCYDVCLLAASQYRRFVEHDDLLYRSYQPCTTTSGYLLSRQGAEAVLPLFAEAMQALVDGGDPATHAVDRCWTQLQADDRFFIFRNKFGYQRAGYSSITGKVDCHFD